MKNRYTVMIFCLAFLIGVALPTPAAEQRRVEVNPRNTYQSAEHRIALVIGNANYRVGSLRNPVNDARAVAAALRELGFEVDEKTNLSFQEMGRAVNRFGQGIRRDSVALFYYAGHGLQVQGSNYLVPVDAEIQDEGEVQFNTVNAGLVLAKMEDAKNPMNIVILDACRDNPFRGFKRSSGSRGLAKMDAPMGSIIAYAASQGKTADDGPGKNGLYTESLIRQMKAPGLKIEEVFKRVRAEVQSKSGGRQVPEETTQLVGDFYFARGSMVVEEPPAPSAVREPTTGKLTVKSNVGRARVYIDGAYEGEEPVSVILKPGTYSIILKKAGYPDAAEKVRIEAGGTKTISIVMEKPDPQPVVENKVDDGYRDQATGRKFPEKPITLIVHAGAGGGSDIFARTLASAIERNKLLPQPIVVENKPGGSGAIAFAYVAGKKKEPYYLLTAVTSFMTTPLMGLTPVGLKDFTPIANFAFDEYMLMVNPRSKYKSMKDIIADAKGSPRKITVGGTQLGSSDSICAYLIEKAAGVQLNYVVFNGGGEVNAALLGGHIDIAITNPGEALELFKAGKVRLLGVYSDKRLPDAPDVPTMREQGVNVTYVQNRGLVAPAEIPAGARKVLEQASSKYMKTDIFKKYASDNMLSEAWMDGDTFDKWLEAEIAKYAVIIKDMGLIRRR